MSTNQTNALSIFKHENFGEIRVVERDGEPWFVAGDVAKVLQFRDAHTAIRGLDADEKGTHLVCTPGGTQEVAIVSEAGLFTLLVRSDKLIAKPFTRWVTHEVLPCIRKHGAYIPVKEGDSPELVMARGILAAESIVKELKAKLAEAAPKVALHDSYLSEGEDISMKDLALKLNQEGLSFGQNRLYDYLRGHGVLCSRGGSQFNMPTQKYADRGWFKVIAPPPAMADKWKPQLRITPKGVSEISRRIQELAKQGDFN